METVSHRTVIWTRETGAVEKRDSQFGLERPDRMADRRLGSRQACGAGSKAARIRDRDERPDLIERKSVQHDLFH